MRGLIRWAAAASVVGVAIVSAVLIVRARAAAGGTPPWDAASHGEQGFAVAQDLRHVAGDVVHASPADFVRDLAGLYTDAIGHQYRYPPVHPLLLAPAYWVFGPGWTTAIGVSAALFAVLLLLLFAAGVAVGSAGAPAAGGATEEAAGANGAGTAVGLLAACLALTSPAFIGCAGTIMLEMPAAVCATAVVWLYGRTLERPDDERRVFWTGWALTAFVLTASQYAACWLGAVAAYEVWRCPADARRRAIAWGRGFLGSRALRHPLHLVVALALAAAVVVAATGGGKFPLGGKRALSITSPYDPLIVAMLALGARVGWLACRRRAELRAAIPVRYRAWFATVVVPLFLWYFVLYPPRLRLAANWVEGSPAPFARTSAAYWTYYPKYFFSLDGGAAAHTSWAAAAAVFALAAASFLRRQAPAPVRFLRWAAPATVALLTAHPARQERFLMPFLPAWWLLAADTAVTAWKGVRRPALRAGFGAAAVGALAFAWLPAVRDLYGDRLGATVAPPPSFRDYEPVLAAVSERAAPFASARVVGTFDGLSHHLFEWELRRRAGRRYRPPQFDLDNPYKRFPGDPEGPRKVFEAWLAKAPEDAVFALEPVDLEDRAARPVDELGKHAAEWAYYTMRFLRETDRYVRVADPALESLICEDPEGVSRRARMYRLRK